MATCIANGPPRSTTVLVENARQGLSAAAIPSRRRQISYEAGKGIEMLGHAIDYLTDEFSLDCMDSAMRAETGAHPQLAGHVAAIQMLMARNREIYFSCPEVPTLGERLRSLLGRLGQA